MDRSNGAEGGETPEGHLLGSSSILEVTLVEGFSQTMTMTLKPTFVSTVQKMAMFTAEHFLP